MRLTLILVVILASALAVFSQSADTNDPLVRVLQAKGILTETEARAITTNASPAEQRDRLAALLRDKGVISATEFESIRASAAASEIKTITAEYKTSTPKPPVAPEPQPTPAVIAAVAPVRLQGIDTPKREGLIPDIKLGTGARLKFYGIFKTSLIHDSSSPAGNDFPLPLLAGDTGPNGSPEFHVRARGLRLGANFEWLDPAPRTSITGKIEFDFEGDFTRVNNRNITSIRSSQPSLRLAWVRIDRRFSDSNSAFVLFGQDWSPFVSSTLPNTVENTNFGGIGYGAPYTRIPQAKFGFLHKFGGSRNVQFEPEIAIVLPAFGNLPSDVSNQLAFGERQGVDSEQPGIQGRAVLQWQLDKAASVAPAQLIFSFEHAKRTAIVTAANAPLAFRPAFPNGAEVSSDSNGYSAEFQLPTHFITVVGKYYGGEDLRFYLAGQLLSNFNDIAGLTSIATATSIDGASTVGFADRVSMRTSPPPITSPPASSRIAFV